MAALHNIPILYVAKQPFSVDCTELLKYGGKNLQL